MLAPERPNSLSVEKAFPKHEVFFCDLDGVSMAGASASSWEQFLDQIRQINPTIPIIASPELITFAGQFLSMTDHCQGLIEARIDIIKAISDNYPDSMFVVGTPIFENGRPANSAIIVKNKEIITQTYKRSALPIELLSKYVVNSKAEPLLIPGTQIGLLICSDLQNSWIPILNGVKSNFVHSDAESILLLSCWGVGGVKEDIKKMGADDYYDGFLKIYVETFFHFFPQINELVVVDRTPSKYIDQYTPTHPFNYYFAK